MCARRGMGWLSNGGLTYAGVWFVIAMGHPNT